MSHWDQGFEHTIYKNLRFYSYKIQFLQAIKVNDKPQQKEVAATNLQRIEKENDFLNCICFTDKTTFHVSEKLYKLNARIWGLENPHRKIKHDRLKVNVWHGILCSNVIGPFFSFWKRQ